MTATEPHHHGGAHVHLDENDWAAYAALTELRGEVFMSFFEETIDWIEELRDTDAPAVRRILDILCDEDDPRGARHRHDLFIASSCQIVIARPVRDRP